MTNVSREARISPGCTGLYRTSTWPAWRRIVEVRPRTATRRSGSSWATRGGRGRRSSSGKGTTSRWRRAAWPILSASPLPYFPHSQVPKEMDRGDMDRTPGRLRPGGGAGPGGGLRLARAPLRPRLPPGQLRLAPHQPSGPTSTGARWRTACATRSEVFDAVRGVAGAQAHVGPDLGGGLGAGRVDSEEAVEIARAFRPTAADIIDVSAGQTVADQQPVYGRQFQTPFSDRIRHEADDPHHGGGQHLVVHRREHHPGGGAGRPGVSWPGPTSGTPTGPGTRPTSWTMAALPGWPRFPSTSP
jgi:anthraniloyl-CoA monooxygenase